MTANPPDDPDAYDAYFLSYSGATLPLKLVSPIRPDETENRNTYFGVRYDDRGRITLIHKRVYGDIELSHRYRYDTDGRLAWAEVLGVDDEGRRLWFDASGNIAREEDFDA